MIEVLLTRDPIGVGLTDRVRDAANGAILSFEGVVRDHHEGRAVERIDYQAYEPMARAELERLAKEIAAAYEIAQLLLVHRIGEVRVGEASLLVAIGSHHRGPAIEALTELIHELKRRVPIWKHEYGPDGDHWVGGVLPGPPDAVGGGSPA